MLEWLKPILGDKYTDDIDAKVSTEIGKNFVAKSDFNQTNEAKKKAEADIKERDKQLEQLKTATGDVDALKAQIAELQQQNATAKTEYEAQINQMRLDNLVETELTAAGAKNIKAVRALLAEFLADAKIAADGTIKGLAAEIDNLVKAEDSSVNCWTATNAADRPNNREYYDDILYADKWSLQAIVNKLNTEEERQVRK